MILHKVQEEQDFIFKEAADVVAQRTGTTLAQVYGVMAFYHFFNTQKPGKNKTSVCLGTACHLKGGQDLMHGVQNLLNLSSGEASTADGMFLMEPVRCIGC